MILLAAPPDAVQQALLATITRLPDSHPRRRRYRLAVAFGTPLFPPDHLLREAPGQPYDTALDRWLALPPIQRRHDVVLLPDEDYYWRDAQAGDGYAAHFLVHLAAMQGTAGAPGTTLDIIQLHARRRHGKTLRLLGRAGPGLYWDIRPVAPSPAATAALAADLAQWLGAAPGRR